MDYVWKVGFPPFCAWNQPPIIHFLPKGDLWSSYIPHSSSSCSWRNVDAAPLIRFSCSARSCFPWENRRLMKTAFSRSLCSIREEKNMEILHHLRLESSPVESSLSKSLLCALLPTKNIGTTPNKQFYSHQSFIALQAEMFCWNFPRTSSREKNSSNQKTLCNSTRDKNFKSLELSSQLNASRLCMSPFGVNERMLEKSDRNEASTANEQQPACNKHEKQKSLYVIFYCRISFYDCLHFTSGSSLPFYQSFPHFIVERLWLARTEKNGEMKYKNLNERELNEKRWTHRRRRRRRECGVESLMLTKKHFSVWCCTRMATEYETFAPFARIACYAKNVWKVVWHKKSWERRVAYKRETFSTLPNQVWRKLN